MEYKKYLGDTFQEAKLKMLLDLGSSGYIISHKKVKVGGFLGFFKKSKVEILSGVLNSDKFKNKVNEKYGKSTTSSEVVSKNLNYGRNIQELKNTDLESSQINDLKNEIFLVKNLLQNLKVENQEKKNKVDTHQEEFFREKTGYSYKRDKGLKSKNLKKVQKILKENEYDKNFIHNICSLSSIQELLTKELSISQIKNFLKKEIFQILKIKKGINFETKANVVCVVGPTGVGKTTTLAKLGAYFGIFEKRKIKFLSLDNYRIGGMQHIEFYANVMNLPFKKIYSPEEFSKEIENTDTDIILVDTSGRSQKNFREIKEMEKYLNIVQKDKLHLTLVVSATTKYSDLLEILEKFDILKYRNLIITKIDETNTMGPVLSAIRLKDRDLAYVTFGQTVPEDIEAASKSYLLSRIFR